MRQVRAPNPKSQIPNKSQNTNPKRRADRIWQFVLVWDLGFGAFHSWSSCQPDEASPFRGVSKTRTSVMECGCPFCRFDSQTTTEPEKRQKRQAHSKSFAISRHHRCSPQRHGASLFRGVLEPRASVMECGCLFCRLDSQMPNDLCWEFGFWDFFGIWILGFGFFHR